MDQISLNKTIFIFSLFFANHFFSQSIYTKEKIKVVINKNWNIDSLEIAKNKLQKDYNINFEYKNPIFNADNTLRSIKIKVDSNDGYSGGASVDTELKSNDCFGFERNYSKKSKIQFKVGFLPKS